MALALRPGYRALLQAFGTTMAFGMLLQPALADEAPAKVQKITVTGSSVKRIQGETALPVEVVTRSDIDKSGVNTAQELLEKISSNVNGYNTSQGVGDSGQPGFAGANMRGLGAGSTLVLINGRRVANYAFNGGAVDLNSIPMAAVERVEVLKDGASAVYGTDAIGGVINFILRNDYQGVDVSAGYEATEKGGGNSTKAAITAGYGDLTSQRFNVLASFNYEKVEALHGKDRDFAATGIRPDLGFTKTSGNAYPANFYDDVDGTLWNTTAYKGCIPSAGSYQINTTTGAPQPTRKNCRYDYTSVLDIMPPSEKYNAVLRGVFKITEDHEAYAEYMRSDTKYTFASSETPVNDFSGNGPFIYPAGGKYYPTTVTLPGGKTATPSGDLSLAWRLKDGGLRTNESHATLDRILAGVKGTFGAWDYDTAFNFSKSHATDSYVDGWVSEKKLKAALLTGEIDPFSGNAQTAVGQKLINDAKIIQKVRESEAKVTSWDAKASRELMKGLSFAAGLEVRKEELKDTPDAIMSSGDIQGGGGALPPVAADRTVQGLYGELNYEVLKGLETLLQVRYDHYSDFGGTTNPKIGVRYAPTKSLLLRGSYTTGFRAPTLSDMFLPNFKGNTANNFSDPNRCPGGTVPPAYSGFVNASLECDAQLNNLQGGNKDLKPEKSNQYTLGLRFEPTNLLSVGLDYWNIERKDTISALGDTTIMDNYAKYDNLYIKHKPVDNTLGVPGAIDYIVQTAQNLGTYKTDGLDVTFAAALPRAEYGRFRLNYDGTYIFNYKYQRENGGEYIQNVGKYTDDNGAISQYRHTLALTWDFQDWSATVAQNFVLGYRDQGDERDVSDISTFDLQGSWKGMKGLTLTAGMRNIFDQNPPQSVQGRTFQVGYDPQYADPRGRSYYLRAGYTFK
ncbi:TonB-dependent receptor [Niveibacterium umoris]|uniref:Iron complex outermembrane receptor protein n=1 Tax=Niveibacterium umoris TaxID=1193620 RepID=A0A840BF04_9RHOO|nr:TonB-dependent receptor [Niveibacterium umoris]MBB4010764.1 iron complex outermembrane receptor protein [Niveibacterium umoris]